MIRIVASFCFGPVIMISKEEILITSSHEQNSPLSRTFFYLVLETLRISFPISSVILQRDPCVTIHDTCNLIFTSVRVICRRRVEATA